MNRSARILVPIAWMACGPSARADVYAYIKPGASVMLTNIAQSDQHASWTVRPGEPEPAAANPPSPKVRDRYQQEVLSAAREYAVDLDLIHAVIATESNYMSDAVSPKGAVGLMQLMPSLAKEYGVTDASDAVQNLRAGVKYLHYLLVAFDGNIELVLAAYNAGEGSVRKYGRRVPPFPETVNYVRAVQGKFRERKRLARGASMEQ